MITCKLYGRLGNQLFIIATTIAYAIRHNLAYGIPQFITRPPGLPTDPIYFTHLPEPTAVDFNIAKLWSEPIDQSYMEIPLPPVGADAILSGHFQSEKYFADQREAVLKIMQLPWEWSKYTYNEIVSIHVRRGDYLHADKKDIHGATGIEYFERAIDFFENRGYTEFKVFSDDIPWCRENINDNRFMYSSFEYAEGTPMEDLVAMSKCKHHIIDRSSYSWWGAWLNRHATKLVVAPKQPFFGPSLNINEKDLLPQNWIKL